MYLVPCAAVADTALYPMGHVPEMYKNLLTQWDKLSNYQLQEGHCRRFLPSTEGLCKWNIILVVKLKSFATFC